MSGREWEAALGVSLLGLLLRVHHERLGGLRGIWLYSCSVASGLRVRLPARPLERYYVSKEGREGDDARPHPPRRCSEYPALNPCLDACSLAFV